MNGGYTAVAIVAMLAVSINFGLWMQDIMQDFFLLQ